MRIICSYCRKEVGEKEPYENNSVTHSICPECYGHFIEQVEGLSLDKYLDKFEAPIIILNADGRIVALNKLAEGMLEKPEQEILGLLGGEAMECAYARLPEGCGRTAHCKTCTIRKVVMDAMEREEPQLHMPVTLKQRSQDVKMVISTDKIGELVRIIIEDNK